MKLIVASSNAHKVAEIQAILKDYHLGIQCVSLKDVNWTGDIIEDGLTFEANALKKAKTVGDIYPTDWILADDSGLCLPSLDGAPGIYSSRYAGNQATDAQNNQKLLKDVENKGVDAYFLCAMVLYRSIDRMWTTQGKLDGMITDYAKGKNGFGYDPIFYVPDFACTLAEMPVKRKNKISHRTLALEALIPMIKTQVLQTG